MTDHRVVMQQALEALERFVAAYGQTTDDQFGLGEAKKVIVALRAAIAQPEQTTSERKLTDDAQSERDDWEQYYDNCSCHLSPPCSSCTHPGNPINQEEDETAWKPAIAQSEQPAPVLQPLTEAQIDTVCQRHWAAVRANPMETHRAFANPIDAYRAFARAVEVAHGITQPKDKP